MFLSGVGESLWDLFEGANVGEVLERHRGQLNYFLKALNELMQAKEHYPGVFDLKYIYLPTA